MASSIQLLRSTNPQERPFAGNLLEGQPAANLHSSEPGLFFKTTDGSVVKFGPAAITSDGSPPNSTPQGSAGNSVGELWLDKSVDPAVLKVYDGAQWVNAGSGGGGGGSGSFLRWIYVASGGETSLSGTSGGVLLEYTAGLEEVFINGVLITRGTDYSAINGTSITNLAPLTAGDVVTVLSMNPLETVQLPGQVTLRRWSSLATAGQTVLSGADSSGDVLSYTSGFEEVYVNGMFLRRGLDYTATSGTSITLNSPLSENDEVSVLAWTPFIVGTIAITNADVESNAGIVYSKLDLNNSIVDADIAVNAGIDASKLKFLPSGSGAVSKTVQDKLREVVSVKDFGAVGDGETDDTPAFQAAIDSGAKCIKVPAPATRYLLEQSLNMTGLRGVTFEFEASLDISGVPGYCQILAKHTNAVFDLTGAFDCCFVNASVEGDATTTPTCMFLLARNSTGASSARHRFLNVRSTGYFSAAPVYNYGSEENEFYGSFFVQKAAGKSCVYLTATNAAGLSSQFATIATGVQSTTVLRFFGGSYYSQGNSGAESEACFVLNGVSDVTIADTFLYCPYGKSFVFVNTTTSASSLVSISGTRGEVSATYPQHGVYFSTGSAATCASWSIRDSRFPVDSNVVYAEDSVTLAGLQYENIVASSGNAVSARNLQDCFINHASSLIAGRAGGTVQRNVFIGYEVNRTLSGTNLTNAFTNTLEGSFQANGFKFPSVQVASSNANTLDDYEEGLFTPSLTCGTPGDLAITYSKQKGFYTKVGRLVTIHLELGTTTFTHSTASGLVTITGLPFTPVQDCYAAFSTWRGFTSAGYTFLGAQIVATVSNVYVSKSGSGQAVAGAVIADFPTGGIVSLNANFSYLAT